MSAADRRRVPVPSSYGDCRSRGVHLSPGVHCGAGLTFNTCKIPCARTRPYQSCANGSRFLGTGTEVGRRPRSFSPIWPGAPFPSPARTWSEGTSIETTRRSGGHQACERASDGSSAGGQTGRPVREDVRTIQSGRRSSRAGGKVPPREGCYRRGPWLREARLSLPAHDHSYPLMGRAMPGDYAPGSRPCTTEEDQMPDGSIASCAACGIGIAGPNGAAEGLRAAEADQAARPSRRKPFA